MTDFLSGNGGKVALIYPFDPLGSKVGGVETFMRGFIKHAPPGMDILHIGITTDRLARPVGKIATLEVGGREFNHYPVLYEQDENSRQRVPLSLRFAMALFGAHRLELKKMLRGRVLQFNKLEPAVVFLSWNNPKVCFIHNDIPRQLSPTSEYAWRKMPSLYFALEKQILGRMKKTYTVNNNTLRLYQEIYQKFSKDIHFLPTWVDESVFSVRDRHSAKSDAAKKFGLDLNGPWLLFAGRLQKQKNPTLMIQSFKEVVRLHPRARLLIVGEGNLLSETKRLAESLSLVSNIDFLGFQSQSDLALLYQAADLLFLTSAFEGMPRCVLEALGCGLPVVTTDVGEVRLVVRPGLNGEIVETHEPVYLAAAVDKVLTAKDSYSSTECLDGVRDYRPGRVLSVVYRDLADISARIAGAE